MLYALDSNGEKVEATKQLNRATCPNCGDEVIAKCGNINMWHWAHKSVMNCDKWAESETLWHLRWKKQFPPDCVEVVLKRDGITHRADILTPAGYVIELQHSYISADEISEREAFYNRMIWIFDESRAHNEERLFIYRYTDIESSFYLKWLHPRRSIFRLNKPFALDVLSDRLYFPLKIKEPPKTRGRGVSRFISKFVEYNGGKYIDFPDYRDKADQVQRMISKRQSSMVMLP